LASMPQRSGDMPRSSAPFKPGNVQVTKNDFLANDRAVRTYLFRVYVRVVKSPIMIRSFYSRSSYSFESTETTRSAHEHARTRELETGTAAQRTWCGQRTHERLGKKPRRLAH
jgi:hypothetical protein